MGQLILRCQQPRSTTTAAPAIPVVIRPTGQNQRGMPLRAFFSFPCSATATLCVFNPSTISPFRPFSSYPYWVGPQLSRLGNAVCSGGCTSSPRTLTRHLVEKNGIDTCL